MNALNHTLSIGIILFAQVANAQFTGGTSGVEHTEALHAQPRPGAINFAQRDAGLHEYFIYDYLAQAIPIVDDFSIDRTRHLNASSADAGVALTATYYHLEVGGVSTPDMIFTSDTTHYTLIDTTQADTIIVTVTALPSTPVTVHDISTYPVTSVDLDAWPTYNIIQYVGSDPDTIHLQPPFDLVQDSLLVYTVTADTRTYTNPDNSMHPLILWEEDEAYVNGTYPIDPPTIGVASFDGMDRTGFPYSPDSPNNTGIADHLTSVPINLQYPASDSVYLSFFYQPQGLSGDSEVQPGDSLMLEMYAPDQQEWFLQWSTPYTALAPFKQVLLPIIDASLLKNGFRMRFSNRASLGGAVDHWHIDYVRLDRNRTAADTLLQDVTFVYPANTLLAPWTSVPFNKFNEDPAHYMAQNVDLLQKNLYTVPAFILWGYSSDSTCTGLVAQRSGYGSNISGNELSTFNSAHPINSGTSPFIYDFSGCIDAGFPKVKFWTNATPDANRYNDTTRFTQEISNYYSYDDGSAEAGYWLNTSGGRIAYRFDTQGTDSLRAVRMYFDPIFTYDVFNDPRDGNFLITIWSDLNNDPIYQNISFSSPEYRLWGPDHFVEYPLDSTIAVGGTFYVGWTQTNAVKMNLGMDKNRVNNDRMFYNVGSGWVQSTQQGSWMMRPVMVSTTDPFASVEAHTPSANAMQVYPNPANDEVWIRANSSASPKRIELLDATGRLMKQYVFNPDRPLSIGEFAPGLYMLRALDALGNTIGQERVIVQR